MECAGWIGSCGQSGNARLTEDDLIMRSGRGVAIAAGQNGADVMCTDGEGTLAMLALAGAAQ